MTKKRIFSALLCMCMALTVLSMAAFADGGSGQALITKQPTSDDLSVGVAEGLDAVTYQWQEPGETGEEPGAPAMDGWKLVGDPAGNYYESVIQKQNSATATLTLSFTAPAATASFDYFYSSEKNWDYLRITCSALGISQKYSGTDMGNDGWKTYDLSGLTPGQAYEFVFTYAKDSSSHSGLDLARVRIGATRMIQGFVDIAGETAATLSRSYLDGLEAVTQVRCQVACDDLSETSRTVYTTHEHGYDSYVDFTQTHHTKGCFCGATLTQPHEMVDGACVCGVHHHEEVRFDPLMLPDAEELGEYITLTESCHITLSESMTLPVPMIIGTEEETAVNVTLCLNGNALDLGEGFIGVYPGATFTLCDCHEEAAWGALLGTPDTAVVFNRGTFRFTSGRVLVEDSAGTAVRNEEGTVHMTGGVIAVDGGVGIYTELGEVNLSGTAKIELIGSSGTGIYGEEKDVITIAGGTITVTGADGRGVYCDDYGAVTVTGGTITVTGDWSNGLYGDDESTVTVTGGTIAVSGEESTAIRLRDQSTLRLGSGAISAAGENSCGIFMDSAKTFLYGTPSISGGETGGYDIYCSEEDDLLYATKEETAGSAAYAGSALTVYHSGYPGDVAVCNVSSGNKALFTVETREYTQCVAEGNTLVIQGTPVPLKWYALDGETPLSGTEYPATVLYGDWVDVDEDDATSYSFPTAPAVEGKVFVGWYFRFGGDSSWEDWRYLDEWAEYEPVLQEMEFKAAYAEIFPVKWYALDGQTLLSGDGYPATVVQWTAIDADDDPTTQYSLPVAPAVEGKVFVGWYSRNAGDESWSSGLWSADNTVSVEKEFKAVYADLLTVKWYDKDENELIGEAYPTVAAQGYPIDADRDSSTGSSLPTGPNNVEGKAFAGWLYRLAGSDTWSSGYWNKSTTVSSPMEFKAAYKDAAMLYWFDDEGNPITQGVPDRTVKGDKIDSDYNASNGYTLPSAVKDGQVCAGWLYRTSQSDEWSTTFWKANMVTDATEYYFKAHFVDYSVPRHDTNSDGDVFLGGTYIEVGVSKSGSFGTQSGANPLLGFHGGRIDEHSTTDPAAQVGLVSDRDGWGVGEEARIGDVFLPGTPAERWVLTYKADGVTKTYAGADRNGDTSQNFVSIGTVDNSGSCASGHDLCAITTVVTPEGLTVYIETHFNVEDAFYLTDVTVVNNSESAVTDVRFCRSYDPDQDVWQYGEYSTWNKVVCNPTAVRDGGADNYAMVVAMGEDSRQGVFFLSYDNRARVAIGLGFSIRDLYSNQVWAEVGAWDNYKKAGALELYDQNGNPNGFVYADDAMAITTNLGDLSAGEQAHTQYYSSLDGNVEESLGNIMAVKGDLKLNTDAISAVTCETEIEGDPGQTVTLTCTIGQEEMAITPIGQWVVSEEGELDLKGVMDLSQLEAGTYTLTFFAVEDSTETLIGSWTRLLTVHEDATVEQAPVISGILNNIPSGPDVAVTVTLTDLNGNTYPASVNSAGGYNTSAPKGIYQIVITVTRGTGAEQVQTTSSFLAVITAEGANSDMSLPIGDKNSTVAGDQPVAVGGLDRVASNDVTDPTTPAHDPADKVVVVLEVSRESANPSDPEQRSILEGIAAADPEAAEETRLVFLDITLSKTVQTAADPHPVEDPDIGDTNHQLLTVVLPFVTEGKENFAVWRNHRGTVEQIPQGEINKNANGEFFTLNDGYITVYAKKFSTYAVSYTLLGGAPQYQVVLAADYGGDVSVSQQTASAGTEIRFTVAPLAGYTLSDLTVTDSTGEPVLFTSVDENTYALTMPESDITVTVRYLCPCSRFTDVDTTQWYHSYVEYAIVRGLMKGTGDTTFAPFATTSRGMIVTVLYRLEGQPAVTGENPFSDLTQDWYQKAVLWAAEKGIVLGYGNGKFGPEDPITREQLAAMLWRYAEYKGCDMPLEEDANMQRWPDAETVSAYAVDAVQWACAERILQGKGGLLVPGGEASRAEAATMLMRFIEGVLK